MDFDKLESTYVALQERLEHRKQLPTPNCLKTPQVQQSIAQTVTPTNSTQFIRHALVGRCIALMEFVGDIFQYIQSLFGGISSVMGSAESSLFQKGTNYLQLFQDGFNSFYNNFYGSSSYMYSESYTSSYYRKISNWVSSYFSSSPISSSTTSNQPSSSSTSRVWWRVILITGCMALWRLLYIKYRYQSPFGFHPEGKRVSLFARPMELAEYQQQRRQRYSSRQPQNRQFFDYFPTSSSRQSSLSMRGGQPERLARISFT